MALTSLKTGWLCIVNIVMSCLIIITTAIGTHTQSSIKGTWVVAITSSGLVLLIIASISFFVHFALIGTNTFTGDLDTSIIKTNFFFVTEILLAVCLGCTSAALLAYWNSFVSDNYQRSGIAAGSFGVVGTVTHVLTAFLSKTTL